MDFGLIGEKLSHSYSKPIHALIGDYDYEIKNLAPHELGAFLQTVDFKGINVTIPYKKAVMPYCHSLSDTAEKLGNVNTIIKTADGLLHGDNTDYYGFSYMALRADVDFEGQDVLILGTGGAAQTVGAVASDRGAKRVSFVSRTGPLNYENVYELASEVDLVINASPVGMYPNTEASPLDLSAFKELQAVLDLIYNPLRPRLIQQAESLGLKNANGLSMLAAQAMRAAALFFGEGFESAHTTEQIVELLSRDTANLVLVGMPGSGKTTIGREVAKLTGKSFVDTDDLIELESGLSPREILESKGEVFFRDLEAEAVARVSKGRSQVIATGGGAILREENRKNLKQNALVVFIDRKLEDLETQGRPLSADPEKLKNLYVTRLPIYKAVSDIIISSDDRLKVLAERLTKLFENHPF